MPEYQKIGKNDSGETFLFFAENYFENSNAEDIKKTNIKTMFVFNLKQRQIRCFFGMVAIVLVK